jgi:hypothetical protein
METSWFKIKHQGTPPKGNFAVLYCHWRALHWLKHMRHLSLLREQLLRILFSMSIFWLLFVFFIIWSEIFQRFNSYPEGSFAHSMFEELTIWLPALIGLALSILFLRHWRGFLLLLPSTSLIRTLLRYFGRGVVLFIAFTIAYVLLSYLTYDSATDPQGQFHIWVWLGGWFYAAAMAPVSAILWEYLAFKK